MSPESILHFWFTELTPKHHFAKDATLCEAIRARFGATLEAAARCELFTWRTTPEGRLAEVLVLDQFSSSSSSHHRYGSMPKKIPPRQGLGGIFSFPKEGTRGNANGGGVEPCAKPM